MKDHNEKSPYPNPQTLGKKKINKTQQIQTQEGKKIPRKKKLYRMGQDSLKRKRSVVRRKMHDPNSETGK